MNWWEQPQDIVFSSEYSTIFKGHKATDLMGTYCPQPSEPEDFSSGSRFVIHDFTVRPDGDVMTFKDGRFIIGDMQYEPGDGYEMGLEPLHLYEIGSQP